MNWSSDNSLRTLQCMWCFSSFCATIVTYYLRLRLGLQDLDCFPNFLLCSKLLNKDESTKYFDYCEFTFWYCKNRPLCIVFQIDVLITMIRAQNRTLYKFHCLQLIESISLILGLLMLFLYKSCYTKSTLSLKNRKSCLFC